MADSDTLDTIEALGCAVDRIAEAITTPGTCAEDATGAGVGSLTEAVIGMTAGLVRIAEAIESLADAVRGRGA